jgi:hypothetical protein
VVSLDLIGAGHAMNTAGKKRRGAAKARLTNRIQGLPALVNDTKQLPPTSNELRAGLIDEPIDPGRLPTRPRRLAERRRESPHPPREAHLINIETTFGQDLLTVTAANPLSQLRSNR